MKYDHLTEYFWMNTQVHLNHLIPLCYLKKNRICRASQVVLVVKNLPANTGDIRDSSLIPGSGSSSGEGNGNPLQYSCLENPMDRGAWWAAVHGVTRSQTRLSDFTFTFHFHALEKVMETHSSVLAWRIPGTGILPQGGGPSMGSNRVGHD